MFQIIYMQKKAEDNNSATNYAAVSVDSDGDIAVRFVDGQKDTMAMFLDPSQATKLIKALQVAMKKSVPLRKAVEAKKKAAGAELGGLFKSLGLAAKAARKTGNGLTHAKAVGKK